MPTKSFLLSKTLWGGVTLYVVSLCESKGYHVADLVAPFSSATGNLIDSLIQFVSLIMVVVGRFQARHVLTAHGEEKEAKLAILSSTVEQTAEPLRPVETVKRSPLPLLFALGCLVPATLTGCAALAMAPQALSYAAQAWTVYHAVQSVNAGAARTPVQLFQVAQEFRPEGATPVYEQLALKAARLVSPVTPEPAKVTAVLSTLAQ